MTLALKDREEYTLGSLTVTALHTPCHTRGHVIFYVTSSAAAAAAAGGEEEAAPLVFSGDTLFVGGCGRFFEGDASQSECSCLVGQVVVRYGMGWNEGGCVKQVRLCGSSSILFFVGRVRREIHNATLSSCLGTCRARWSKSSATCHDGPAHLFVTLARAHLFVLECSVDRLMTLPLSPFLSWGRLSCLYLI